MSVVNILKCLVIITTATATLTFPVGLRREESGKAFASAGSYVYTDSSGKTQTIQYTYDGNEVHIISSNLSPEEIPKAIEQIKKQMNFMSYFPSFGFPFFYDDDSDKSTEGRAAEQPEEEEVAPFVSMLLMNIATNNNEKTIDKVDMRKNSVMSKAAVNAGSEESMLLPGIRSPPVITEIFRMPAAQGNGMSQFPMMVNEEVQPIFDNIVNSNPNLPIQVMQVDIDGMPNKMAIVVDVQKLQEMLADDLNLLSHVKGVQSDSQKETHETDFAMDNKYKESSYYSGTLKRIQEMLDGIDITACESVVNSVKEIKQMLRDLKNNKMFEESSDKQQSKDDKLALNSASVTILNDSEDTVSPSKVTSFNYTITMPSLSSNRNHLEPSDISGQTMEQISTTEKGEFAEMVMFSNSIIEDPLTQKSPQSDLYRPITAEPTSTLPTEVKVDMDEINVVDKRNYTFVLQKEGDSQKPLSSPIQLLENVEKIEKLSLSTTKQNSTEVDKNIGETQLLPLNQSPADHTTPPGPHFSELHNTDFSIFDVPYPPESWDSLNLSRDKEAPFHQTQLLDIQSIPIALELGKDADVFSANARHEEFYEIIKNILATKQYMPE